MIVKICGIKQKSQAKAIDGFGADMIGAIFYPLSKRFVGENMPFEEDIKAKKVGVFVDQSLPKVLKIIKDNHLDFVQFHGSESVAFCRRISKSAKVIKAFGIDASFDFSMLKPYESYVSYFLFDTATPQKGGSGQIFDWSLLHQYQGNIPFLLSGGIGLENLKELLHFRHKKLAGFDINSKVEVNPGNKDLEKVKQIINEIRSRC